MSHFFVLLKFDTIFKRRIHNYHNHLERISRKIKWITTNILTVLSINEMEKLSKISLHLCGYSNTQKLYRIFFIIHILTNNFFIFYCWVCNEQHTRSRFHILKIKFNLFLLPMHRQGTWELWNVLVWCNIQT